MITTREVVHTKCSTAKWQVVARELLLGNGNMGNYWGPEATEANADHFRKLTKVVKMKGSKMAKAK